MITAAIQKYILMGGGIVVLGLLLTIGVLHLKNGSLKNDLATERLEVTRLTSERDEAVRVAAVNAEAVEIIRAERDTTLAILDRVRASDAARQEKINMITKEVARAKRSECPAGDGLAAAHDWLRKLATGEASY